MKDFVKWILLGILLIPINALCHESGHYLTGLFFGAENIVLHYASVSSDTDHLTGLQKGLISIAGPLISYLFLIIGVVKTRSKINPIWFILGIATTLRGLVNIPFLIGSFKGTVSSPNFDEYNFAINMNISPIVVSIIALLITLFACLYFSVLIYKKSGIVGIIKLWISVITGLVSWGIFGKYLFP